MLKTLVFALVIGSFGPKGDLPPRVDRSNPNQPSSVRDSVDRVEKTMKYKKPHWVKKPVFLR